jgi:D-alanyl-D-alanine carboxypeptidase
MTPRRVTHFIALVSLVAVLPTIAGGQSFESKASEFVSKYASEGKFRGVILVGRGGKILVEKAYGNAVEAWNVQNAAKTRFELASLTKQFTGAAILQLAQAGKLNLDDPVSKYYKQAPDAWSQITIRELANHTSGLPNNGLKDFQKGVCVSYTPEELIASFKDRPLNFTPGTSWAYTNTEYYLLAYIIQTVSGQGYGEYLSSKIFQPIGMNDSGFAATLAVVPQMAEGYAKDGNSVRHRDYFDRSLEVGAGGVYSTAHDLLLWDHALNSDKLLNHKWLDVMFTPSPQGNYGFGWFIEKKPRTKYFHEGSDPGFAAFEIRYLDEGVFIVVLSNFEEAPVRLIANQLANLLFSGRLSDTQE